MLKPIKIIYNEPATIVIWNDGTKTVVKCEENIPFDKYAGFCAALAKKIYGDNATVKHVIKEAENTDRYSDKLPSFVKNRCSNPFECACRKAINLNDIVKIKDVETPSENALIRRLLGILID